mmetsp:Transcript_8346/g.11479  ORF Transcript_8346/g.11479 Transcript_8346/m.11479 type:complete len:108 (+) Transcript_8346:295-618(+)
MMGTVQETQRVTLKHATAAVPLMLRCASWHAAVFVRRFDLKIYNEERFLRICLITRKEEGESRATRPENHRINDIFPWKQKCPISIADHFIGASGLFDGSIQSVREH